MINKIWFALVAGSIGFALFSGRSDMISKEIFGNSIEAIKFLLEIAGGILFWSGILKIIEKADITEKMQMILRPIGNILFRKIKDEKSYRYIVLCLLSAFLGLGNAATPIGIKAMEEMQKKNTLKTSATPEMKAFVLLNITMIQLLPMLLISVRTVTGSNKPYSVILPIWGVALTIFLIAIFATKSMIRNEQ